MPCSDCKFSQITELKNFAAFYNDVVKYEESTVTTYECRKNPPFLIGYASYRSFPEVRATDWCGSFENKEKEVF